jgi:methionyl-tRNA formyltransferase
VSSPVYLGTSSFAATILRRLARSAHRPRLVVTPPDRRQGRGRRSLPPPAALAAKELDLELLQTADVNEPEALARIRAAEPEVGAVCAFGQLIREPLLSELLMLNVHPSLLPRWRGAAPIERAIMAGDAETGVSVMQLGAGLDSGPVALRERFTIEPEEDYGALAERLAQAGAELLVRALDLWAAGRLELVEQDQAGATYAEKIDRSERRLDPARPAPELARQVRALSPHIGAFVELEGGERLGVRTARPVAEELEAGTIAVREGRLLLGCAQGALALEMVQPAGRTPMPAGAYLRGHQPPRRAAPA